MYFFLIFFTFNLFLSIFGKKIYQKRPLRQDRTVQNGTFVFQILTRPHYSAGTRSATVISGGLLIRGSHQKLLPSPFEINMVALSEL